MSSAPFRIALVPLDERPVNTRYPQMLGAIAGAKVLLPPSAIAGRQRVPADTQAVGSWLEKAASEADAIVASADYLCYGNLINARISNDSSADVLPRLKPLEAAGNAEKPVYAFGLITRVSNADDPVEEPTYWATYGTRFYKLSQILHRADAGKPEPGDAETEARLRAELPADLVSDWLVRRLRNHTINLALMDLLARNRLSFLLLTSDDTSAWGMPSREKAWLEGWARLLGPTAQNRLMLHPGADEVGSALVARLVCERNGLAPRVYPMYAVPGGEEIVAPYEDRAVRLTVEGQIRACGGTVTDNPNDADVILGVLTPSPRRTEFRTDFADSERREREGYYRALFAQLGAWQQAGRPVALGDVAYPNGADPLAMELLLSPDCPLDPAQLLAWGAWNTAGNTLGVVVAQAFCALLLQNDPARAQAQAMFLAHRFLEDWGYQAVVRREARAANVQAFGTRDPNPDDAAQVATAAGFVETGLRNALQTLQQRGIGRGLTLAPGSVRLPWRRTFEVDFDLAFSS